MAPEVRLKQTTFIHLATPGLYGLRAKPLLLECAGILKASERSDIV